MTQIARTQKTTIDSYGTATGQTNEGQLARVAFLLGDGRVPEATIESVDLEALERAGQASVNVNVADGAGYNLGGLFKVKNGAVTVVETPETLYDLIRRRDLTGAFVKSSRNALKGERAGEVLATGSRDGSYVGLVMIQSRVPAIARLGDGTPARYTRPIDCGKEILLAYTNDQGRVMFASLEDATDMAGKRATRFVDLLAKCFLSRPWTTEKGAVRITATYRDPNDGQLYSQDLNPLAKSQQDTPVGSRQRECRLVVARNRRGENTAEMVHWAENKGITNLYFPAIAQRLQAGGKEQGAEAPQRPDDN